MLRLFSTISPVWSSLQSHPRLGFATFTDETYVPVLNHENPGKSYIAGYPLVKATLQLTKFYPCVAFNPSLYPTPDSFSRKIPNLLGLGCTRRSSFELKTSRKCLPSHDKNYHIHLLSQFWKVPLSSIILIEDNRNNLKSAVEELGVTGIYVPGSGGLQWNDLHPTLWITRNNLNTFIRGETENTC